MLTNRQEILQIKRIIGSELSKIQQAFYDEQILQYYKDNNEAHLYLGQYDCLNYQIEEYTTFNKIIGLTHSNLHTFTEKLTEKFTELLRSINAQELIIISHLKLDFFGNRGNSYPPLRKAYKKLKKNTTLVDKETTANM